MNDPVKGYENIDFLVVDRICLAKQVYDGSFTYYLHIIFKTDQTVKLGSLYVPYSLFLQDGSSTY